MADLTKLAGLWVNESKKDGRKFFAGKIDDKTLGDLATLLANNPGKALKVLIFKNDRAENERAPGYNLFCQPVDEPKPATQQAPQDDTLPF